MLERTQGLTGYVFAVGGLTNHQHKLLSIDGIVQDFMKKFKRSGSFYTPKEGGFYFLFNKEFNYIRPFMLENRKPHALACG